MVVLRVCLSILATTATVFGHPHLQQVERTTDWAGDYLQSESLKAITLIRGNIGPDGVDAKDASPGIVIASPTKAKPPYYYSWTRDSALTYLALLERFQHGNTALERYFKPYVAITSVIQNITSRSGGPNSGGLGEPKFEINATAFNGEWSRPQRDGPALRATSLMIYSVQIYPAQKKYVANTIWPLVRNDLQYLVKYWNHTGYDLWENTMGSSFWTIAATHHALRLGVLYAQELGHPKQVQQYQAAAEKTLCFMQSFWTGSFIKGNLNVKKHDRTGLDASTILASTYTFDPSDASCNSNTFQPCSDRALSNFKNWVDSFRSIYDTNKGIPSGKAVSVGRYAEDVYYGGNPWYLTVFAAAEQLYDAVYIWEKAASVTVTDLSLPFFKDLISTTKVGTFSKPSKQYTSIISAVKKYADEFVAIGQKYTPADGFLAEQFSRHDGKSLSASNLTWSSASVLKVAGRRSGDVPLGWGSNGMKPSCGSGRATKPAETTLSLLNN